MRCARNGGRRSAIPRSNALEEQVAVSNQTVAQAEAQFRGRARGHSRRARRPASRRSPPARRRTRSRSSATSGAVPAAAGTIDDYQLPLDFSYEADLWGRVRRSVESSVASRAGERAPMSRPRVSAARPSWRWTTSSCAGSTPRARCSTRRVPATSVRSQLTTARYDQGVASGVDVAQAQTQLDTTRAQAIDLGVARAQFEHAIAILDRQAARGPHDSRATVRGPPPADSGRAAVRSWSSAGPTSPPRSAAWRRRTRRSASREAAFFPTLALTASGGLRARGWRTLLTLPSRFWSIGPALAETVFDGGRRAVAEGAGGRRLRRDGGRVSPEHADGVSGCRGQPRRAAHPGGRGGAGTPGRQPRPTGRSPSRTTAISAA